MNTHLRVLIGFLLGAIIAGFGTFGLMWLFGSDNSTALVVGAVAGALCAGYGAHAFNRDIYGLGFFSVVGFILDVTWSMLNTLAGLLVWIPACLAVHGSLLTPNDKTQRSGTFVYDKNPRGQGWDTTIGTVIAGSWSSHEEVHVWQARLFGPLYLVAWGLGWLLQLLFLALVFKVHNIAVEAYGRICFEDWAYWGGTTGSSGTIYWGKWIGGFFLSLLYVGLLVTIPVGVWLGIAPLWIAGTAGLCLYHVIRALTPSSSP